MNPMINIGTQAVREAGKLLIRSMEHLEAVELKSEDRQHFTAELKRLASESMCELIHKAHPSHAVVTEDNSKLGTQGEACWILDGLCGEINFMHSLPHFAVSIAIKLQDKIQSTVVYDFLRDELFTASRGQGARLNDRRLRVSQNKKLSESIIATSVADANLNNHQALRISGCSILDFAYVAAARLDAYHCTEIDNSKLAGILLVTEAGGLCSENELSLLVSNAKIHNELKTRVCL